MSYTIPIGPYHPALEEPYKNEVQCEGETVRDTILQIGFNFRAIEWLAERRNYIQNIALFERVCGICSGIHTLTFCLAVERLAEVAVPERAQYIRVIITDPGAILSAVRAFEQVFYYVASDGSDVPLRVQVRTPSFANMPTVRLMVQGATLADAPLIQASIDPCYACTDR